MVWVSWDRVSRSISMTTVYNAVLRITLIVITVAVCELVLVFIFFFFSSRRRHTRFDCDWSSDVCSSDLEPCDGAGGGRLRSRTDGPRAPPRGGRRRRLRAGRGAPGPRAGRGGRRRARRARGRAAPREAEVRRRRRLVGAGAPRRYVPRLAVGAGRSPKPLGPARARDARPGLGRLAVPPRLRPRPPLPHGQHVNARVHRHERGLPLERRRDALAARLHAARRDDVLRRERCGDHAGRPRPLARSASPRTHLRGDPAADEPGAARVIRDGVEMDVPTAEVRVGDFVRIRPGERVPVDGVVTEGASTVDESMLTGESLPAEKAPESSVFAGTVNRTGSFVFRAARVGSGTTLARIIKLVAEAQGSRAPIQRLADRVAAGFVPIVLVIAALTVIAWWLFGPEPAGLLALAHAVAVLVVAWPCAIGLPQPTAVLGATRRRGGFGRLLQGAGAR